MDKIMQISAYQEKCSSLWYGTACAIPAVAAARNIENWKGD
jgi:Fe2+ transport system protein B